LGPQVISGTTEATVVKFCIEVGGDAPLGIWYHHHTCQMPLVSACAVAAQASEGPCYCSYSALALDGSATLYCLLLHCKETSM